jgi:hypothetical protein
VSHLPNVCKSNNFFKSATLLICNMRNLFLDCPPLKVRQTLFWQNMSYSSWQKNTFYFYFYIHAAYAFILSELETSENQLNYKIIEAVFQRRFVSLMSSDKNVLTYCILLTERVRCRICELHETLTLFCNVLWEN